MERLTIRNSEGKAVARRVGYYDILDKLALYEDLEELLEQTYGECSGLLEKAVRHLIRHEGAEFEKPLKSRLLTDEDVDKWQEYKQLDEQGLLLKLPCKVGSELYCAGENLDGRREIISLTVNSIIECFRYGEYIGNGVYLTKAEAEKALAEMEK